MKVYVLNDTSKSPHKKHAGSVATMKALHELLSDHEVVGRHCAGLGGPDEKCLDECDVVVCNGEGTMHHDSKSMRFLMKVLDRAQKMGKKTMLINSVWDSNSNYDDTLRAFDFLSFREELSQMDAGMGRVFKDLVFNNEYEVPPKSKRTKVYTEETLSLTSKDFQELIYAMADCSLYQTSRYHGVILAMISNTPFEVLPGANTHKIEGLLKTKAKNLTKAEVWNGH